MTEINAAHIIALFTGPYNAWCGGPGISHRSVAHFLPVMGTLSVYWENEEGGNV